MKKIYASLICCQLVITTNAQQEFNKQLSTARASYASGKLEDSRFAMQQMLQELDMITGKEILKTLPTKMQDQNADAAKDNVSGTSGFVGVLIHREYGAKDKLISLDVISNSPLITSINAVLSLPFIGSSGEYKVIKVGGYKALIQKVTGENNKTDYELQLPMHSTLITLKAPGYTQEQLVTMANSLPVQQIAKLVQ